jgi:D-alanyl-D-alanine carboxypeptidase
MLLAALHVAGGYAQSTTAGFDTLLAQQLQAKLVQLGTGGDYDGALSAAVLVPGQGIWTGTWGRAAANTPATPDMRFGIASNSKAITAGLILKLQDEGWLHLDDPIGNYLPPHPQIDAQLTIRQLLMHTSGLFDFINQWSSATQAAYSDNPNRNWTFDDLIATIGSPAAAPNTGYSYSNTNYLLLGRIAEVATGLPIYQLLHSRVFDPLGLGMAYPPQDNVFAAPYSNLWNTSGSATTLSAGSAQGFLTYPSTAGAVWATAYDMVRWYDALFGDAWLSADARRDLRDNDGYIAYGLGIRLRNDLGRSLYYHAGAWGFRSYMLHDPSTGISLCLLTNQYGTSVTTAGLELFAEVLNRLPAARYDVSVRDVIPNRTTCLGAQPIVTVKNEGTATIHQLQIALGIDGEWRDTLAIGLGNGLLPGTQRIVPLAFDLGDPDGQRHQLQALALIDSLDAVPANNVRSAHYRQESRPAEVDEFEEDFESAAAFPASLVSRQPGNALDWRVTQFAGDATPGHALARINYYDGNVGDTYTFELPLLRARANSLLQFSYAHAFYPGVGREVLRGYVSTNCGLQYSPLFELSGNALSTAASTTEVFLPNADQWRQHTVALGDYADEDVLIRFELENQFGNMTYLDDIRVSTMLTAATEPTAASAVTVWPNPAQDYILVGGSNGFEIGAVALLDALGRTLRSYPPTGALVRIDRQRLPAGCYYIVIDSTAGRREMRKVIFQ